MRAAEVTATECATRSRSAPAVATDSPDTAIARLPTRSTCGPAASVPTREPSGDSGVVQVRRAYANGRIKHPKTRLSRRAVPLQTIALEALDQLRPRRQPAALPKHARRPPRLPQLQPSPLEAGPEEGRDRAAARSLRPAPYLRHLCAPRRRSGVRALTVHGHEHRDDRPPLRPPRSRQLPARRVAPRRAGARAGRGRWVDAGAEAGKAAQRNGFQARRKGFAAGRGRSVDMEARSRHDQRRQKGLISRNFAEAL